MATELIRLHAVEFRPGDALLLELSDFDPGRAASLQRSLTSALRKAKIAVPVVVMPCVAGVQVHREEA